MQTLSQAIGKQDPDKSQNTVKRSNLSLVDETTSVGVEIEMENLAVNYMSRGDLLHWERKTDGSLRGQSREFVFSAPLKGDTVIKALESLSDAFADGMFVQHKTLRTSMHVHVNMLNVNRLQLMSIMIAALLADKALFNLTDNNRKYLGYSIESEEALAGIISYLHDDGETEDEIRLYTPDTRYYSMNASALSKYGTLEFRHFSTPETIEEAVKNINACLAVKQCGMTAWESAGNDNVRKDLEAMYHLVRAQIEAAFGAEHEMPTIEKFLELIEEAKIMITYKPEDTIILETELQQMMEERPADRNEQPDYYENTTTGTVVPDAAELERRVARMTAGNSVYQEYVRTGVMPPLF
jgi:hypothetical protein